MAKLARILVIQELERQKFGSPTYKRAGELSVRINHARNLTIKKKKCRRILVVT